MIKITYLSTFLVLFLCVFSCDAEEISLTINNLKLDGKNLQFDFVLTNDTENPIWFCRDIDYKSSIDYEIKINDKNEINFRLLSVIVPPNIYLEEPIWAEYSRLESKKNFKGNIKVKVPINDLSYFDDKKSNDNPQTVSFASTLSLEIGIYKMNLEEYKKACCAGYVTSQNAFVNCFWAEKNKEQIIRTQIKKQTIPIVIQ